MRIKSNTRGKSFAILSIFLLIFGCIFLDVFAFGEDDATGGGIASIGTDADSASYDTPVSDQDDSESGSSTETDETSSDEDEEIEVSDNDKANNAEAETVPEDVSTVEVSDSSTVASVGEPSAIDLDVDDVSDSSVNDELPTAASLEDDNSVHTLELANGILELTGDATLSGNKSIGWTVSLEDAATNESVKYVIDNLDYVKLNVPENKVASIDLDNFELTSDYGPAIALESGTAKFVLTGTNTLQGAIGCAGVYVAPDTTLTIDGDGNGDGKLYAYGGSFSWDYYWLTDSSYLGHFVNAGVKQIRRCSGAGIGGNGMVLPRSGGRTLPNFGTISIIGGYVVAVGGESTNTNMGSGAGIGSGGQSTMVAIEAVMSGTVAISGGIVDATGGTGSYGAHGGAGIGSGGVNNGTYWNNHIEIVISGGTVKAKGGKSAAGIGGGDNVDGGPVTISGGNITSYAGDCDGTVGGAGIGGGDNSGTLDITICGKAKVAAYGAGTAAGIGSGNCGGLPCVNNEGQIGYATIRISDEACVTAYGGSGKEGFYNGGAGIGLSSWADDYLSSVRFYTQYDPGFESIIIEGSATVRAYAGPGAQAVGAGSIYDTWLQDATYGGPLIDTPDENEDDESSSSVVLNASNSVVFNGSDIDVWMFNSDTQQGAFYGQTSDGSGLDENKSTSFSECNGVWYTSTSGELGKGGTAYVSDSSYADEFTWSSDGSTVSVDFLGVAATSESNNGYAGNWATVNVQIPEAKITLTPVSITSYVGGTSASGNHVPVLRFAVSDEGLDLDLDALSYKLYTQYREPTEYCIQNGIHTKGLERESVIVTKTSSDGSYYTFDKLEADMGSVQDVSSDGSHTDSNGSLSQKSLYLKLVDMTANADASVDTSAVHAGVYRIMLRSNQSTHWENWYLVATDMETGAKYLVKVDAPTDTDEVHENDATVTVRFVSTEYEMYAYTDDDVDQDENVSVSLTQVLTNRSAKSAINTSAGAVAVVDSGTSFMTNGHTELGVFGASVEDENSNALFPAYVDESEAKIALLFDDVLSGDDIVGVVDSSDLEDLLVENIDGVDLSEYNVQHKYLDLVNFADGNAQVTADSDVTVYWPYPDGVTYEDAKNYNFRLVHYKGLEREYMTGATDVEDVEELVVEATPYGLKFTTASFSPFTLLWQEKKVEEPADDPVETPENPAQVVPDDTKQDDPDDTKQDDPRDVVQTGEKTDKPSTGEDQTTRNEGSVVKTSDSTALSAVTPATSTATSPKTYDATIPADLLGMLGCTGAGLATLGIAVRRKDRRR